MSRYHWNKQTHQKELVAGAYGIDDALSTTSTNSVQNAVISNALFDVEESIAPREDGTTISQTYAVGAEFYHGNDLCRAKTTIASGTSWANLVLNTHYELAPKIVTEIQTLTNEIDGVNANAFANGCVNILPCDFADGVINGVTFIKNSDGTVSVNGKNVNPNAWSTRSIGVTYVKQGERYKVSGCPSGGSENTYEMFFVSRDGNGTGISSLEETGDGGYITASSGVVYIQAYIRCYYDVQVNNLVFKPMITLADIPNSDYAHYVPYAKTNRELTEKTQYLEEMTGGTSGVYPYRYLDGIYTTIESIPNGFWIVPGATTSNLTDIPSEILGRLYVKKAKASDEYFIEVIVPYKKAIYYKIVYGATSGWYKITPSIVS